MQDARKAVWSIPYVSVAFFPSLKHNLLHIVLLKCPPVQIAIFEIHQLWQSGLSRVYSNCCCSCWYELEIIKIGQSSHKIYSNNILNVQVSMSILTACIKTSGNLLNVSRINKWIYMRWYRCIYIYIYIYIYIMSRCQHGSPWPSLATIVHYSREVFKATSCIGRELLYVGYCWLSCLCSSMWWGL